MGFYGSGRLEDFKANFLLFANTMVEKIEEYQILSDIADPNNWEIFRDLWHCEPCWEAHAGVQDDRYWTLVWACLFGTRSIQKLKAQG